MTVKELKEIIKDLPDHLDVVIQKNEDQFDLSLLEQAYVRECTFTDEHIEAEELCLVLTDEI